MSKLSYNINKKYDREELMMMFYFNLDENHQPEGTLFPTTGHLVGEFLFIFFKFIERSFDFLAE